MPRAAAALDVGLEMAVGMEMDEGASGPAGTTPHGLISTFSPDFGKIETLQLAKDTANSRISFVDIPSRSPLKTVLRAKTIITTV